MPFLDLNPYPSDSNNVLLQKIAQRLGAINTDNESENTLLRKILTQLVGEDPVEIVTEARTYYVATTGSDSNDGLSSTSPFLTIQAAVNAVQRLFITENVNVTIQIADGTYTVTSAITCRTLTGIGQVIIQGNTSDKNAVVVSTATASINLFTFIGNGGSRWVLQHLTLAGTSTNIGISCDSHGRVSVGNLRWSTAFSSAVSVALNSTLQFIGTAYEIAGAMSSVILCQRNAFVLCTTTGTWTITGTPALGVFVSAIDGANVRFSSANVTFSGSATGNRYSAVTNSLIQTNGGGASFFPGNGTGSVDTQGLYL